MKLFHKTGLWVVGLLVLAGSISSLYVAYRSQNVGAIPNSPALIDTYLVSNIDKTATSMTLSNGTDRAGNTLSGYTCFTIDVNTPTVEYVCGTASGTAITALQRGVDVSNPNTTSTNLAYPHRRFASVQVSDYPTLQFLVRAINGVDAINNNLKVTTGTGQTYVGDNIIATQGYVDNVGAGGFTCSNVSTTLGVKCTGSSPEKVGVNPSSTQFSFDGSGKLYAILQTLKGIASDASGFFVKLGSNLLFDGSGNITINASTTPVTSTIPLSSTSTADINRWVQGYETQYTAGEAINASTVPQAVYLSSLDGKIYKSSVNFTSSTFQFIGFVAKGQNVTTNDSVWVTQGDGAILNGFSGFTTGTALFVSVTGTVTGTIPATIDYKVARAVSNSSLVIEKGNKYYSGNLTLSASGTSTIQVGFRIGSLNVYAITANPGQISFSNGGWTEGAGAESVYKGHNGSNYISGVSGLWFVQDGAGTTHTGSIANITNNSFDLVNVKAGSPSNCYVYYQAIGY